MFDYVDKTLNQIMFTIKLIVFALFLVGLGSSSSLAYDVIKFCKVGEVGDGSFTNVQYFEWNPNGESVVILSHDRLEVWNVLSNTRQYVFEKDKSYAYIVDFDWNFDGSKLAMATNLSVSIFDLLTGDSHQMWKPLGDDQEVYFIDWAPNEDRIAIRTFNQVIIWDLSDDKVITELSVKDSFSSQVVWSPDGNQLAFSNGYTVVIWNTQTSNIERVIDIGNHSDGLFWKPDSTEIAVSIQLLGISVFDIESGNEIIYLDGFVPVVWLNNNRLLTGFGIDPGRRLVLWNTETWGAIGHVQIENKRYSQPIALQQDSTSILTPSNYETILMIAKFC